MATLAPQLFPASFRGRDGLFLCVLATLMLPEQVTTLPRFLLRLAALGPRNFIAIAREFIADPNWAYRAAQELGLEDPHGVLPFSYAFYLRRRAELQRA